MTEFGKYTLQRKIGEGGMAAVYLATESGPSGFEKKLCLKTILPHRAMDERFVEMFLDEARTAAKLSHPNLVQIFGLGREDDTYYIAMEYVEGVPLSLLSERLNTHPPCRDSWIAARLISRLAGALDYAHRFQDDGAVLGLVHRDVSPDNILLSFTGTVKLIDFGIAKANTNQSKTVTGAVKGKFRYMSPEQIRGMELDGRSDQFSLGVVLYELLTGKPAFENGNGLGTVSAILNDPVRPPIEWDEEIPVALSSIVLRMLSKDREERFHSCGEVEKELETILRDAPQGQITDRDLAEWLEDTIGRGELRARAGDWDSVTLEGSLQQVREGSLAMDNTLEAPISELRAVSERSEETLGRPVGNAAEGAVSPSRSVKKSGGYRIAALVGVGFLAGTWFFLPSGDVPREKRMGNDVDSAAAVEGISEESPSEANSPPTEAVDRPPKERTSVSSPRGILIFDWSKVPAGTRVSVEGKSRGETPMAPVKLRRKVGKAVVVELTFPDGQTHRYRRKVQEGKKKYMLKKPTR